MRLLYKIDRIPQQSRLFTCKNNNLKSLCELYSEYERLENVNKIEQNRIGAYKYLESSESMHRRSMKMVPYAIYLTFNYSNSTKCTEEQNYGFDTYTVVSQSFVHTLRFYMVFVGSRSILFPSFRRFLVLHLPLQLGYSTLFSVFASHILLCIHRKI